MTLPRALALVWLATAASVGLSHATPGTGPRCTEGTWTIDGGPATVGPLAIHAIQLADGTPFVTPHCRAQRWERRPGELRVLFVCRNPDESVRPLRFPLRLRARLTAACARLDGAFAVRRRAAWVRFSATKTGAPCTSDDACAAEAYCSRPVGECTATEGRCAVRPLDCGFGTQKLVCGCDGRTWPWCDAVAAGVSIAANDPCPGSCGGVAEIACPAGQFCDPLQSGGCFDFSPEGQCVTPSDACPEIHAPVCGCDRVTYANDCLRQNARARKAYDGACGNCTTNGQCVSAAYCAKPAGACDAHGECTFRPLGCPDNVDPVCGCDATTYFNACEAAAAGTSVARPGECAASCGGIVGVPCPEGQFCELPANQCSSADLEGHCVATSGACPEYYSPVCGCDGVTYANDCFRQAAGAQKASDGACECVPLTAPCASACDCYRQLGTVFCDDCPLLCPSCGDFWQCKDGACVEQCGVFPPDVSTCMQNTCGGIAGLACTPGMVCQLPDLGGCGADIAGECVPIGACTLQYDPVCGCDGKTYSNDCARRNAGVQRAHPGPC